MKNKLMVAGAILGAVLFLSGCGKQGVSQNTPPQNPAPSNPTAADQSQNAPTDNSSAVSGPTSLQDLMALGKDMECTWKATDNKGKKTDGKVDVSGSKFKMSLETDNPTGSGKVNYYTLNDGTWVYSWGMMPNNTGTKIKLEDIQKMSQNANASNTTGTQGNTSADWQNKYDYQCSPWAVSGSDFTPPTDIKFMDMTQLLNTSAKGL